MQTVRTVQIGDFAIGQGQPLALIAGPCMLESYELAIEVGTQLKTWCAALGIPYVFKASYDKANRTSISSYRGPGIVDGLKTLARVREALGVPVLTDVHEAGDFAAVGEVVDIVQIPAFLCRQTDMLVAAAKTGKVVNVKKGQFLAPGDMANAVEKVLESGNQRVFLTDRGASFGYNNLITDIRAIPVMHRFAPVCFDATHSVQLPGGQGKSSGGQREFVRPLSRAAVAAGADCLFLEVHPEPAKGLSDAASMFPLAAMESFLREVKALADVARAFPEAADA